MKVIVIHGKNKSPEDVWYSYIMEEVHKLNIRCAIPDMGQVEIPEIAKWLKKITDAHPDNETVLVGHSRGGMAILRWLGARDTKIKKLILVGTNSSTIEDQAKGDFYSGVYNFEKIKENCADIVVMHSKDDEWVPYSAAKENASKLGAKLVSFDDKGHFGKQKDGSDLTEFPELLEEILK